MLPAGGQGSAGVGQAAEQHQRGWRIGTLASGQQEDGQAQHQGAGEAVPHGDQGGQNTGHHRGHVHLLLVSLLHHVHHPAVLPGLRRPAALFGALLAWLLQLRRKPHDLRPVLKGLSLRLQADYLQVLLLPPVRLLEELPPGI